MKMSREGSEQLFGYCEIKNLGLVIALFGIF